MLYCFVDEDLQDLTDTDPLYIQFRYAKKTGNVLLCNLSDGSFSLQGSQKQFAAVNTTVLLRATCDSCRQALSLLANAGAQPLETLEDIERIRRWYTLGLTGRKVLPVTAEELIEKGAEGIYDGLTGDQGIIFVKTIDKGFSLQLDINKLKSRSKDLTCFFETYCPSGKEELLVSPWRQLKRDSLGIQEARFFIIDRQIRNASRLLHSVKHSVPRTLRLAGEEFVSKIGKSRDFPSSYVLDVAMFGCKDGYFADIVEINPLSVAMCYINNSIYDYLIEEYRSTYEATGWGYEFCMDAVEHPERYFTIRAAGVSYEYTSDCRFSLV